MTNLQHLLLFISVLLLSWLSFLYADDHLAHVIHQLDLPHTSIFSLSYFLSASSKVLYYSLFFLSLILILTLYYLPKTSRHSTLNKTYLLRLLLLYVTTFIVLFVLVVLLKAAFSRPRPSSLFLLDLPSFHLFLDLFKSFPSAHSARAASLATLLSLFFPSLKLLFIPLATLVALSRIVLEQHFLSDIIFGSYLGFVITIFVSKYFSQKSLLLYADKISPHSSPNTAVNTTYLPKLSQLLKYKPYTTQLTPAFSFLLFLRYLLITIFFIWLSVTFIDYPLYHSLKQLHIPSHELSTLLTVLSTYSLYLFLLLSLLPLLLSKRAKQLTLNTPSIFYMLVFVVGSLLFIFVPVYAMQFLVGRPIPSIFFSENLTQVATFATSDLFHSFPSLLSAQVFFFALIFTTLFPRIKLLVFVFATFSVLAVLPLNQLFLSDLVGGALVGYTSSLIFLSILAKCNILFSYQLDNNFISTKENLLNYLITLTKPIPQHLQKKSKPYYTSSTYSSLFSATLCLLASLKLKYLTPTKSHTTQHPHTILLLSTRNIDTIILAYPALVYLRQQFPQSRILFLSNKNYSPLLLSMNVHAQEQILVSNKNFLDFLLSTLKAASSIRKSRLDVTICLDVFARLPILLSSISHAHTRIGFFPFHNESPYIGNIINRKIVYNPQLPMVQSLLNLSLSLVHFSNDTPALKYVPDMPIPTPALQIKPTRKKNVTLLKKLYNLDSSPNPNLHETPFVIISPSNAWKYQQKCWPTSHYVQLVNNLLLAFPQLSIFIIDEFPSINNPHPIYDSIQETNATLTTNIFPVYDYVPPEQLVQIYHESQLLITDNLSYANLASTTNLSSIIILGPDTPNMLVSYDAHKIPHDDYLHNCNQYIMYKQLRCSPCLSACSQRGSPCTENVCLSLISPQEITKLAVHLLKTKLTKK